MFWLIDNPDAQISDSEGETDIIQFKVLKDMRRGTILN